MAITHHSRLFSTYSIVARDPDTGQIGVAVQTHQMSVGAIVPVMLPGRGALATQSLANQHYGPMAMAMLREAIPAEQVVAALVATDPEAHFRQLGVVDAQGGAAAWTGSGCIAEASHHTEPGLSVQANMMTNPTVIQAMVKAFRDTSGGGYPGNVLARRLLAALFAAEAEGGDIRGMQSAALRIVPGDPGVPDWTTDYDLRVDEHSQPLDELARLVRLRSSLIVDEAGHAAMEAGLLDEATLRWQEARALAPELEELPFWQAVALAEQPETLGRGIVLFKEAFSDDPLKARWIDLIRRLQECGLLKRQGAAAEFIQGLG